ncbi:hypothetical protein [Micromonospora sp. NBC_01796]|uniref:hypothetical protein n=1 Tax=Micromonospora sp. NBC_01796 TaxID=2975987 RepID=UPI002DDB950E|nr:hypothetical protein [Micromonospora sp. NBC_01796]WSA87932.1 hypothetical protein OIE47_10175 [Micromonospora sp. NBC_01796]
MTPSTGTRVTPEGAPAARLNARLHTILSQGADPTQLAALHRDAADLLGDSDEIMLLVECSLEYALSPERAVADSLAAWLDLRGRALTALPEHHPTMLAIRGYYIRWLRRRGEPGDLDLVVQLWQDEVDLRRSPLVGRHRLGVATADLAGALLDRARWGHLDPHLKRHEPGTDLAEAHRLVTTEMGRRAGSYGVGHACVWQARLILADILCAQVQQGAPTPDPAHVEAAFTEADAILRHHWQRHRRHGRAALRAQLVRAEMLTLLGRNRAAEREARLAAVLARGYRDLDLGGPLLALARAQSHRDRAEALRTALEALRERRLRYPPTGHRVAEAEQLVQALSSSPDR